MPEEARNERESGWKHGVKSHVSIPLWIGGRMLGVLAMGPCCEYRKWPDEIVDRLRLVWEISVNAYEKAVVKPRCCHRGGVARAEPAPNESGAARACSLSSNGLVAKHLCVFTPRVSQYHACANRRPNQTDGLTQGGPR